MQASNKKNSKKGLGRGFDSLIPTELLDESFDPTVAQDNQVSELRNIKISEIVTDDNQPRKQFEQSSIEELALSIQEHGVLQPVIVTPHKGGYQIVAGERRFHAAKIAGIEKIPALVRTLTGQHKLEVSLIENLQRKDLNDMETATAYLKLRDQFNLTLEEIGKRVGNKSVSTVSNKLRLLRLPVSVQQMIVEGALTEGQTKPLVGLDPAIIEKVAPRIIKEEWSARKVEQFVVNIKNDIKHGDVSSKTKTRQQPYAEQLKQIQKHLKTDVHINTNLKGAGRITIKFKNKKEFERLRKLLG